ncbi:MAG: hypothetical protein ACXWA3_07805, partial [Acidimicrobiales bacterium]
WSMAAARDGSLSVAFGLGKYVNRNVMDAFAGVSRQTEQWTVRASRKLAPTPEQTEVGPVTYEVIEPLRRTRIALAPTEIVPISFDIEIESEVPPVVEDRETHVSRSRYRLDADVVRFHQSGVARGWVAVDGERVEVGEGTWVGARDRSWGVRYGVGQPLADTEDTPPPPGTSTLVLWMPVTMTKPDGRTSTLFVYYQRHYGDGWSTGSAQGAIELPDGRRKPFRDIVPSLSFDDGNRRLIGGELRCVNADGTERVLRVEPVSATGFHLGTGLYGGFEGHVHGEYRGELNVEGEHIEHCDEVEVAHRIHQHRDCIVRVEDTSDGSTGVGSLQSIVAGPHPELGLTEAASFS